MTAQGALVAHRALGGEPLFKIQPLLLPDRFEVLNVD